MLPVNCGSHADYQNFVVTNLRKYYPNPNALARSTWDIIERFWISIYLLLTLLWLINIQNSDQPHELLLACNVRTFFPLTLKLLH